MIPVRGFFSLDGSHLVSASSRPMGLEESSRGHALFSAPRLPRLSSGAYETLHLEVLADRVKHAYMGGQQAGSSEVRCKEQVYKGYDSPEI